MSFSGKSCIAAFVSCVLLCCWIAGWACIVEAQSSWEQQLRRDRPSRYSTAVTRRTANEAKYPALRVIPKQTPARSVPKK